MEKQSIDTDKVAVASGALRSANGNINTAFGTLRRKGERLSVWKGQAGEAAITKMYEIFKGNEIRSDALENYVNMLDQRINPGYVDADNTNKRLADLMR